MSPPPRPAAGSFDQAPFIVFWETTRACDLVCKHCRACAVPDRHPYELTTDEGKRLLDDVNAMGCKLVVLTGGDPAMRPDLVELVAHGTSQGLRVALTPSATPRATTSLLHELHEAGLARLALSIDAARASTHDAFRGVPGSYARSFEILRTAREIGLTTQVNTTITRHNVGQLYELAAILETEDIELWSVFLLVPTGRGAERDMLPDEETETLMHELAALHEAMPYDIKTTAAPFFRRVLLQRKVTQHDIVGLADGIGRAPRSVNDGQGTCFVSHVGQVYPSGFLPMPCGHAKDIIDIYRESPLFRALREPERLEGKCGACEFRRVCGGSRARARAMTGNVLAEDPSCAYIPAGWKAAS